MTEFEETIIKELRGLKEMFVNLKGDVKSLNERMDSLQDEMHAGFERTAHLIKELDTNELGILNKLEGAENKLECVECDVRAIKLTIENDIKDNLVALADGYQGNFENIQIIKSSVQKLEDDKEIDEVIGDMEKKGLING